MRLQDRRALVTGAASGIGRASAIKFAQEGAILCVSDVNADAGEATAQMIRDAGGEAFFVPCDVSNAAEVEAMLREIQTRYGKLDVALNNAGVGGDIAPVDQVDEPTWDFVMNVNLKGVWLCMKHEIPLMLASGGGSIINVSSLAGLVGFRNNAVYSASKHGVIGLTKSAALEYARKNIRVNAICPGFTETAMVEEMIDLVPAMSEGVLKSSPMRRLGTVDEIAEAALFLAADSGSFITGHALVLDGGASAQ